MTISNSQGFKKMRVYFNYEMGKQEFILHME